MPLTQKDVGKKYVQRNGDHAGTIKTVTRVTDTSVWFKNIAPGDNAGPHTKSFDPSGTHHVTQAIFEATMIPYTSPDKADRSLRYRREYTPTHKNGHDTYKGAPVPAASDSAEMTMSLMTITPILAQEWLDRGGLNRFLNMGRARSLGAAIRRGEWRLTGDAIKLDKDGKVRDGQHRLAAIVEAGIPVKTWVAYGVEENAFDVMDTGRSRSISDVLHIRGFGNRHELSTTVRNLITLESTSRIAVNTQESQTLVTPHTVLQYLQKHPEVEDAVKLAMDIRKVNMPGGVGLWASLLECFRRVHQDNAATFIHRLTTGEHLERGDAILILRNHLLSDKSLWLTQSRKDREKLGAAIILAWNAFRQNTSLRDWRQLEWHSEGRHATPFPQPV